MQIGRNPHKGKRSFQRLVSILLIVCTMLQFIMTSCNPGQEEAHLSDDGSTEMFQTVSPEEADTATDTDRTEDTEDMTAEETTGENSAEVDKYKYVVVIGVDGAGSFFKNASTPNIDTIFANGAITYNMLTANPTISAQCWGSLLHGVSANVHGLTNSIISFNPIRLIQSFRAFSALYARTMPRRSLHPLLIGIR